MTDDRKQSIGALWLKRSEQSGREYYTGEITLAGETTKIVAFLNDRKTKDTQPDIRIYVSEPRGDYQKRRETEQEPNRQGLNDLQRGTPTSIQYPEDDINPDDIPF